MLKSKVILVQYFPGLGNIDCLLRGGIPGQLQACIEIRTNQRPLLRAGGLLFQPGKLFKQLFLNILGQIQRKDLLLIGKEFLIVIILAQLMVDHLQLLPQVIIPLILIDCVLNLFRDIAFDLHNLDLAVQDLNGLVEALYGMGLLQQRLLVVISEAAVLAQKIRHKTGIVCGHQFQHILCRAFGHQIGIDAIELIGHPEGCLQPGLSHPVLIIRHHLAAALKVRAFLSKLGHYHTGNALHQNTNHFVRHFQDLPDMYQNTGLIQLIRTRLIRHHILLHQKDHLLVTGHSRIQRPDGFFTAHVKGIDHFGEHGNSPQGHNRGHNTILYAHGVTLLSIG